MNGSKCSELSQPRVLVKLWTISRSMQQQESYRLEQRRYLVHFELLIEAMNKRSTFVRARKVEESSNVSPETCVLFIWLILSPKLFSCSGYINEQSLPVWASTYHTFPASQVLLIHYRYLFGRIVQRSHNEFLQLFLLRCVVRIIVALL